MKLSLLKIVITLLFFSTAFAQDKEIEILTNQLDGNYVIVVKNNSNERKEVTLIIESTGYANVKSPIIKLVNKGETTEFVTLKPIKGKTQNLSYGSSNKSKPTDSEIAEKTERLKTHIGVLSDDFSKGIYVFTKEGCPRCERTLNYLVEKNLNFKFYNTSKSPEINALMWKKIKEKGASEKITMPVVLFNGKISHSHTDLTAFLKTLK